MRYAQVNLINPDLQMSQSMKERMIIERCHFRQRKEIYELFSYILLFVIYSSFYSFHMYYSKESKGDNIEYLSLGGTNIGMTHSTWIFLNMYVSYPIGFIGSLAYAHRDKISLNYCCKSLSSFIMSSSF